MDPSLRGEYGKLSPQGRLYREGVETPFLERTQEAFDKLDAEAEAAKIPLRAKTIAGEMTPDEFNKSIAAIDAATQKKKQPALAQLEKFQADKTKAKDKSGANLVEGEGAMVENELVGQVKQLESEASEYEDAAQLNRECEKRANHEPIVSDLRESGQIEQDADTILFLYRASMYDADADPKRAQLFARKNRGGTCGEIPLRWDGPTQTFVDGEYENRDYTSQ